MSTHNQQIADGFRVAKEYLAHTNDDARWRISEFICISLELARNTGHITSEQASDCRSIICDRLGGQGTFDGWLSERLGQHYMEDQYGNHGRKTQATRHAWLDSLIQEFSQ